MRVLELGRDLDLAAEPFVVHSRRELGGEDLHHDLPAERDVVRDEDAAHAAARQLALDGVTGREGGLQEIDEI
jgi:hypothetical protein